MFSCEYWKIPKSTFFEEHLRTAASEVILLTYLSGSFQNHPDLLILQK